MFIIEKQKKKKIGESLCATRVENNSRLKLPHYINVNKILIIFCTELNCTVHLINVYYIVERN